MKNDGFHTPEPDDLDVRTAAYLAAGPKGDSDTEYQCVLMCQQMVARLDNISRATAECDIILARTNGRLIRFLNSESPMDLIEPTRGTSDD